MNISNFSYTMQYIFFSKLLLIWSQPFKLKSTLKFSNLGNIFFINLIIEEEL